MSLFDTDLAMTPTRLYDVYELHSVGRLDLTANYFITLNFSKQMFSKRLKGISIPDSLKSEMVTFRTRNNVCSEYLFLILTLMTAEHLGEDYLKELFTSCLMYKWKRAGKSVKVVVKEQNNNDNFVGVELYINTYASQKLWFVLKRK